MDRETIGTHVWIICLVNCIERNWDCSVYSFLERCWRAIEFKGEPSIVQCNSFDEFDDSSLEIVSFLLQFSCSVYGSFGFVIIEIKEIQQKLNFKISMGILWVLLSFMKIQTIGECSIRSIRFNSTHNFLSLSYLKSRWNSWLFLEVSLASSSTPFETPSQYVNEKVEK